MTPTLPQWVQILSALLTPTIAAAVGVIALLQWRINRNKLRLDLFEKRYAIYQVVRSLIGVVIRDGSCNSADLSDFLRNTQGKEFLLSSQNRAYLDELYEKGSKMAALIRQLKRTPVESEREALINEVDSILGWYLKQTTLVGSKFSKDLHITH